MKNATKLLVSVAILSACIMTNGPVFAQNTNRPFPIKLFDERATFATGPVTSPAEALPFAAKFLVFGFAPGDTAVVSSTPDGTGTIVIDNFLTINDENACVGQPGDNCFGHIIDPNAPSGVPIRTVLLGVPPIDVTNLLSRFSREGITEVTFELKDFGNIAGNADLYLVINPVQTP
jgi:hypothetical protein